MKKRQNKNNKKKSDTFVPEKVLKEEGMVLEALPSAHFRVKLDSGEEVMGYLAGKLRIYRIKILPGDRVTLEMSPYDATKGRIVYRKK